MKTACVLLLWASALHAEEVPFSLEWDAVAESRGYVVQLAKAGAAPAEIRVQENRLKTSLPEGLYQARVAGLNKFGKPGAFSDWVQLRLEPKKELSLNLSKPAPPPVQRPEPEPETRPAIWPAFVPGLQQIRRGQVRGYFIAGSMIALGAAAYHEKKLGDALADSPWNNPVFLAPVIWSSTGPAAGALYFRRNGEKERYLVHQQNQRWLLGSMVLLYGLQAADAILWKSDKAVLRAAPGRFAIEVSLP